MTNVAHYNALPPKAHGNKYNLILKIVAGQRYVNCFKIYQYNQQYIVTSVCYFLVKTGKEKEQ